MKKVATNVSHSVNGLKKEGSCSIKSKYRSVNNSKMSPIFKEELPNYCPLTPALIKNSRATGSLNLSSKNIAQIPSKVWSLNSVEKDENRVLSVALDEGESEQKWWEFMELQKLILANNIITEIPPQISSLSANLQILDMHDNRLVNLPSEIGHLSNLVKLDLSRNAIKELPSTFYNLKELTELKLSHNSIQLLSKEIGNFNKLTILDLSHNEIEIIPPDIGYLSRLSNLNLAHNKISILPPDFSSLTALRSLDLSENRIQEIGSLFSTFSHLELLYLFENGVKEMPNFGQCFKLRELYMRFNKIEKFNSSYFNSSQIQLIDLRSNKIKELLIDTEDLEKLDRFYLDNNDIENLPVQLPFLVSIKQLTLEGNPLRGIRVDILKRGSVEMLKYLKNKFSTQELIDAQKEVKNSKSGSNLGPIYQINPNEDEFEFEIDPHRLKQTKVLNLANKKIKFLTSIICQNATEGRVNKVILSHNLLTQIPECFESVCGGLRELELDHNKLSELPIFIPLSSSSLNYLNFQKNLFSSLPPQFSHLNQLREINLSFNKFTTIPPCLYELPHLEILIAQDNKIEDINIEGLKKCKKLAVLNLENNSIRHCPPELGLLQLNKLLLQGNIFKIPGYQILEKGTDAILSFLRNRVLPPPKATQ